MKKMIVLSAAIISVSGNAEAAMTDSYGGPDSSAQTVHHCGFLPMSSRTYTSSSAVTRVIERKLVALGYFSDYPDGVYGKKEKLAIKRFQFDNGLQVTGEVDSLTAQRLAYNASPSPNVHRCFGLASSR
jgi:peptidoglycan hydrolase-like protein with peptidoglycan-binding domain